jgi:hypothetical protein
LDDFINQCKKEPEHVKGAFVVLPSSFESRNDNYLIMIRNTSTIQYAGLALSCAAAGSVTNAHTDQPHDLGATKVEWVSGAVRGDYGHSEIQFLPLAAMTSIYLAFAPQRVYQTTTTHVFPVPPTPLPAAGYDSTVQTVNSSTLNSSGTASLQTNVVNAAGVAALLFGRGGTTEHFTVHAAEAAADDFVDHQLKSTCKNWDDGPAADPGPTPDPYLKGIAPSIDAATAALAGLPPPKPAATLPIYCTW